MQSAGRKGLEIEHSLASVTSFHLKGRGQEPRVLVWEAGRRHPEKEQKEEERRMVKRSGFAFL